MRRVQLLLCVLFFYISSVYAQQEKHQLVGSVYTSEYLQPLVGANIVLLGKDSTLLGGAVTNDAGYWAVYTHAMPDQVLVSHIGYQTFVYKDDFESSMAPIILDTCYLVSSTQLEEVVISSTGVKHLVDAESYLITEGMRSKASNTLELLDQIHGVKFDKVSNSIYVGTEAKVLFLVDGLEQTKDYILNLNPQRIAEVELSRLPKGRYMSAGYGAIVNIKLKKDYQGYDVYLNNFLIANLSGNNGDEWMHMEQPSVNLAITHKKTSAYMLYGYGRSFWNTPIQKQVVYDRILKKESSVTTKNNPNDVYDYQGNLWTGGINYAFNENHTLAWESNYTFSKIKLQQWYNYTIEDYNQYSNPIQHVRLSQDSTMNNTRSNDFTNTLYYKGRFSDQWSGYADVSYNSFDNDVSNFYRQKGAFRHPAYLSAERNGVQNDYSEKRRLASFNMDLTYALSPMQTLNMGYSMKYRTYKSDTYSDEEGLDYAEWAHQLFAYYQYQPNERFGLELGTGLEFIRVKQQADTQKFFRLLPYANIKYTLSPNVNMRLGFKSSMEYPNLAQLNPTSFQLDTLMVARGNPQLKSSVQYVGLWDVSFWNRLTITSKLIIEDNSICDYIQRSETGKYLLSPVNMKRRTHTFGVNYDQPLTENLSLSNTVEYYYKKVKLGQEVHSGDGWIIDSSLDYYNPMHNLMLQLNYARTLYKDVYLQGYQQMNFDAWSVTAMQQLCKGKLSIMLTYTLPIKLGLHKQQERTIRAFEYTENLKTSMVPYRSMLMLRVGYRLGSGKTKKFNKKHQLMQEERIRRTVDL